MTNPEDKPYANTISTKVVMEEAKPAPGTSRPRTKRGRGAKRTLAEWESAINANGGSVKGTARTLEISPREVRRRRDENPALADLFKQATEDMNDRCEGNLV